MKTFISILLLLVFSMNITYCQQTDYEKKVYRMMELSGVKKNFDMALESMIQIQKDSYGDTYDLSDEYFSKLEVELRKSGEQKLLPMLAPIYKKHLTEEQLDGIIAFYESEVGQSLVNKTPLIVADAMQVGAIWGEEIGLELINRLQESDELDFEARLDDDCSKFHNGNFEETNNIDFIAKINRENGVQTEAYSGTNTKYSITWVSNNRYVLIGLDAEGNEIQDIEIIVNIYEVLNDSYKYVAKMKGVDDFKKGEIRKVN